MLYRPKNVRQAIAATEMAILAPFILAFLLGLWEVGRYVAMQNLLDNAAREGGRLASSGAYFCSNNKNSPTPPNATITLPTPSTNTSCELQQRVLLYLKVSGVSTTGASVTVTNNTRGWSYNYTAAGAISGSGYDPAVSATQLDQVTLLVTVPYQNVAWSPLSYFIGQSTTMSASTTWNSMLDIPLTVSTSIPSRPILSTDPLP